jgi:hypothetical protein
MKRILEVKKHIGNLSKNSKNPFFKSAYLDLTDLLNAVEPLLQEQGLVLLQPIMCGDVWSRIYEAESGEIIAESSIELPDIKDPQKLGSCITYFRRYTLKSLLAIAEGDDDGNLASQPAPVKKQKTRVVDLPKFTQTDAVKHLGLKTPLTKLIELFNLDQDQMKKYSLKLNS